jgi:hypothetical protein
MSAEPVEPGEPMTRAEWLAFHLARAPEITDEQWEDTLVILALTRNRRRRGADRASPADGEHDGTGALGRVGGIRGRRPPT